MKRGTNVIASLALMSVIASIAAPNVYAKDENFTRVWGISRYDTCVQVSKSTWKNGSDYVVIASGEKFADALSSTPLAKKFNAPIILSTKHYLTKEAQKELKRLNFKKVFIVGEKGVVSSNVEKQVKKINPKAVVDRIGGKDRYETSAKIAKKLDAKNLVLASGGEFADALSISSIAADKGMPILLTKKDEIPKSIQKYIDGSKYEKTYIVGGKSVVSEKVEKDLKNVKRISGKNRYETNLQVIKYFKNEIDFDKVFLAAGGPKKTDFADAISASTAAAMDKAPVILVSSGSTKVMQAKELLGENIHPNTKVYAIGGKAVVSDKAASSLKVEAKVLDKDNDKLDTIDDNVLIKSDNVNIKNGVVNKNLYVTGNEVKLSNIKVQGTIYLNPGKEGNVFLDNVQASAIKVVSAGDSSVHLKNVKAKDLNVASHCKARIVLEENSSIDNTNVTSKSILEVKGGKFGKVTIKDTSQDNMKLNLIGIFDNIEAVTDAEVEVSQNGLIKNLKLNASNINVKVNGKFENIEVLGENNKLSIEKGSEINKIIAKKDVKISKDVGAKINIIEAEKGIKVTPGDDKTELPEVTPPSGEPEVTPPVTPPGGDVDVPSKKSSLEKTLALLDGITINSDYKNNKVAVNVDKNLQDVSAKEVFDVLKDIQNNKNDKNKEAINKITGKYDKLSKEKDKALVELNIKSSNAQDIKKSVVEPFLKQDVSEWSDMKIIKELIKNIDNYNTLVAKTQEINDVPVPQITVETLEYDLDKVTVKIGDKIFDTGTAEDGLSKKDGKVQVDYEKLISKVKNTLGYNRKLKDISLKDVCKNSIEIQVQFKPEKGENINYTLTIK